MVLNAAISGAILLGIIGVARGFGAAEILEYADPTIMIVAGMVVGFAAGWNAGETQAFRLRLEAQEVLCRMMTEKNTADLLALMREPVAFPATVPIEAGTLQHVSRRRRLFTRIA